VPAGCEPFVLHVFPDSYVDVLWGPAGQLRVAGPDARYRTVALPPGEVIAVRFGRGGAAPLLGVPISEVANARVPLDALWGGGAGRLAEQLEAAVSEREVVAAVRGALLARLPGAPPPDGLVNAAMAQLERSPATRVADLCDALGVTDRRLRRHFHVAVGLTPKTVQRIFRVRLFLRLAAQAPHRQRLADLATTAGFVDQAHLTNECVELMGFTPVAILQSCASRRDETRPVVSDSSKTKRDALGKVPLPP
jgi:AraC-like DNA-binding protein